MSQTVLIVEDDPSFRRGLAALIGSRGHVIITAGTVADGKAQLAAKPSHVLLDMTLPDEHGTALLRHVRSQALPIKVAVLSGAEEGKLVDEMQSLKPDAVFKKPPDWDALVAWVSAA